MKVIVRRTALVASLFFITFSAVFSLVWDNLLIAIASAAMLSLCFSIGLSGQMIQRYSRNRDAAGTPIDSSEIAHWKRVAFAPAFVVFAASVTALAFISRTSSVNVMIDAGGAFFLTAVFSLAIILFLADAVFSPMIALVKGAFSNSRFASRIDSFLDVKV